MIRASARLSGPSPIRKIRDGPHPPRRVITTKWWAAWNLDDNPPSGRKQLFLTLSRGAEVCNKPCLAASKDPAYKRLGANDKFFARALEQGLEESMAGSDPPSIVQPGKNFTGPKD